MFDKDQLVRFWNKVTFISGGCWVWHGSYCEHKRTGLRYGQIRWGYRGNELSHRVAYMIGARINLITPGLEVRHTCHNTLCVNPRHLVTGTHKENEDDKDYAERRPKGESHYMGKLTWSKVKEIRCKWLTNNYTLEELATIYNVTYGTISQVVRNIIWKDDSYCRPPGRRRKVTNEIMQLIISDWENGTSQSKIAKTVGLTKSCVSKRIRHYYEQMDAAARS